MSHGTASSETELTDDWFNNFIDQVLLSDHFEEHDIEPLLLTDDAPAVSTAGPSRQKTPPILSSTLPFFHVQETFLRKLSAQSMDEVFSPSPSDPINLPCPSVRGIHTPLNHVYFSDLRLGLIRKFFQISQGARFGELKRSLSFLLLSNTHLDPSIHAYLDALQDPSDSSRLVVEAASCRCAYRQRMHHLMAWDSKGQPNILAAARAYGAAVAFCVPEKQTIASFLLKYLPDINRYGLKVELQEQLYRFLLRSMERSRIMLALTSVLLCTVYAQDSNNTPPLDYRLYCHMFLNEVVDDLIRISRIDPQLPFHVELEDGSQMTTRSIISTTGCDHQQFLENVPVVRLNLFPHSKIFIFFSSGFALTIQIEKLVS